MIARFFTVVIPAAARRAALGRDDTDPGLLPAPPRNFLVYSGFHPLHRCLPYDFRDTSMGVPQGPGRHAGTYN